MRCHKLRSGVNWQGVLQTKSPRVGVKQDLNVIAIDIPFRGILFYVNSALNDSFPSETTFQVSPFFGNFDMFFITFSVMD
jgi:hypothetical protein